MRRVGIPVAFALLSFGAVLAGMALEPWGGAILKWPEDRAEDKGLTVWHVAP
ncbi:MAG TPA: hypothetical protein VLT86_17120 [Vicinamibacterales bacterium]|nr:hypothetical protein [Vicinamibacterales bacterium]